MKPEGTPAQRRRLASRSTIKALGAKARHLRQKRRLTRRELGDRAALSANYIGAVELGQRDPCLSTVEALARGLGIPVSELFGPPRYLSERAVEMAKLFNEAPEAVQRALLNVLRVSARMSKGTK
jgi:transcriptional regulator with XRE-family HTH domain